MQAIETKFIGPTNCRGTRVRARCEAGSVVVAWDYALDAAANHDAAALALVAKLGWDEGWHPASLVRGAAPSVAAGYVYVFAYDCREADRVAIPRRGKADRPELGVEGEDYVARPDAS